MSKGKILQFDDFNTEEYINSPAFKSDDLLEEAYEATSKSKAIKLAKQALEVYPDNIDAENLIAQFEDDLIKRLKKYSEIVEKATKLLNDEKMFEKENIGCFWGIIGTRPYMRARHGKILTLMGLGRYTEAAQECEDLLRLCESDNMGIRYLLAGLYCALEKFEECEKLYKNYGDDSLHMIFPMCIMYFKKGDYKKAKQFLVKIQQQNAFVLDFLTHENVEILSDYDGSYYSYGSEEEAFLVLHDMLYVLASVPYFVEFVVKEYKK